MRRLLRTYDLRDENGIRWWRLNLAPFDFLLDPGFWIKDTRVEPRQPDERGIRIGPFVVRPLLPQLYFDHGEPPWRKFAKRSE